jgi:hypothetical protein
VGNSPTNFTDPSGNIPLDEIADVAFIAYDLYQLALDPNCPDNQEALGLDLVGLAIPYATGLGAANRVRKAAAVAKETPLLLQAPRQLKAAWGASNYRHGGLMTGIEHIIYRHGPTSGFANVSRFAEGTRAGDISRYVDSALRNGSVTSSGLNAYTIEHNLGRTIGTDIGGNAASSIRVHIRDGIIQTAFPF